MGLHRKGSSGGNRAERVTASAGGGVAVTGQKQRDCPSGGLPLAPIQLFSKQTASGSTLEPQCGPYPPGIEYVAVIYDKGQGVSNPDPG